MDIGPVECGDAVNLATVEPALKNRRLNAVAYSAKMRWTAEPPQFSVRLCAYSVDPTTERAELTADQDVATPYHSPVQMFESALVGADFDKLAVQRYIADIVVESGLGQRPRPALPMPTSTALSLVTVTDAGRLEVANETKSIVLNNTQCYEVAIRLPDSVPSAPHRRICHDFCSRVHEASPRTKAAHQIPQTFRWTRKGNGTATTSYKRGDDAWSDLRTVKASHSEDLCAANCRAPWQTWLTPPSNLTLRVHGVPFEMRAVRFHPTVIGQSTARDPYAIWSSGMHKKQLNIIRKVLKANVVWTRPWLRDGDQSIEHHRVFLDAVQNAGLFAVLEFDPRLHLDRSVEDGGADFLSFEAEFRAFVREACKVTPTRTIDLCSAFHRAVLGFSFSYGPVLGETKDRISVWRAAVRIAKQVLDSEGNTLPLYVPLELRDAGNIHGDDLLEDTIEEFVKSLETMQNDVWTLEIRLPNVVGQGSELVAPTAPMLARAVSKGTNKTTIVSLSVNAWRIDSVSDEGDVQDGEIDEDTHAATIIAAVRQLKNSSLPTMSGILVEEFSDDWTAGGRFRGGWCDSSPFGAFCFYPFLSVCVASSHD